MDNEMVLDTRKVVEELKKTSKGKLTYDRNWKEDGRAKDIISEVKLQLSAISVSPQKHDESSKESLNIKDTKNEANTKSFQSNKYKVTQSETNFPPLIQPEKIKNEDSFNKISPTKITQVDLVNYEKERIKNKLENIEKYSKQFENYIKEKNEELEEQKKLIKQRYLLAAMKKSQIYKEEYDALMMELNQKKNMLEANKNHDDPNNKLIEIKNKDSLRMNELIKKKNQQRHRQILDMRSEIDKILQQVIKIINDHENEIRNNNNLHNFVRFHQHELINIIQNIDRLLNKNEITNEDVDLVINSKKLSEDIRNKLAIEIEKEINRIKLVKEEQKRQVLNTDVQQIDVEIIENTEEKVEEKLIQKEKTNSNPILQTQQIVFKKYIESQHFLNTFEKSLDNFSTGQNHKRHRTDLQQFIKTTINTISNVSVDHLRDKLNKLSALFNNKVVEFHDKSLSCNNNPEALNFSMLFCAKTFLSVATKQVMSIPKAAFPMSAIIVQLWNRYPLFGKLFLALIQDKCPYVVPYYPKRSDYENENTYLLACGYSQSSSGALENEETFLNRMRAMIRIYSAIIQSNLPAHPHDINHAWMWLAGVVNIEPKIAITPAILHAFLSVSSHKLYATYQKQFIKLLFFIQDVYIQKMKKVSEKQVKKQSLVQLEMFINELIKKLRRNVTINSLKPEGVIPDYFWQTQFSFSRY